MRGPRGVVRGSEAEERTSWGAHASASSGSARRARSLAERGGGESGGEGEGEVGAGHDDVATGGEVARSARPRPTRS